MAEHNETDSDCPGDGWLSSWEKKCLDEWEKESVFEDRLQVDNEKTSQKIWQSFQNSATAVSRLFKGITGSHHFKVSLSCVLCYVTKSDETLRRQQSTG